MTIVTQGGIAAPEIELLVQIIRKLDQAWNLAVEVGGFNVHYVISIALVEANLLLYSGNSPGVGADIDPHTVRSEAG
jgi:hypothetical protein